MGRININFDEVPDRILPLEPGVYTFVVESATLEATKDRKGEKVVVELRVDDPNSPNHNRKVYDHLSLRMPIGLKQLIKSAGLRADSSGVSLDELVGKVVRARVKTRTYKDEDSQEVKETSAIAEYIW